MNKNLVIIIDTYLFTQVHFSIESEQLHSKKYTK